MYQKTGLDAEHPLHIDGTKVWAIKAATVAQYLVSSFTFQSDLAKLETYGWTVGSNVAVDNTCQLTGSLFTVYIPMGTTSSVETLNKVLAGVDPAEYCVVSTKFGQLTGKTADLTSEVNSDMVTLTLTYAALLAIDLNLRNLDMLHFMHSSEHNHAVHSSLP